MTPLECQCGVRGEMAIAGAATELCHHTTLVEIESIKNEVILALTKFDRDVEIEKILTLPPNEAAEHFVQAHIKSTGQVYTLSSRERKIMKSGFLRYMSIVIQCLLLETLSEIRKEEA